LRINRKEKHNTHFQSISSAFIHVPSRKEKEYERDRAGLLFCYTYDHHPEQQVCVRLSLDGRATKEKERISSIVHIQCQGNVVDDRSSSHVVGRQKSSAYSVSWRAEVIVNVFKTLKALRRKKLFESGGVEGSSHCVPAIVSVSNFLVMIKKFFLETRLGIFPLLLLYIDLGFQDR
jgi:hypothetical protein